MDQRTDYDAKLEHILSRAARVFAERGFHRATIRDVAKAAGTSLSGLYYYVESKDELLYLIQHGAFETLLTKLDVELASLASPRERLERMVRIHLGFFLDHMPEMKVISHEGASLSAPYVEDVRALKRRYATLVRGLIRGLRPDGLEVDERVATFALFGQLNWIYTWYRPGRDPDLEALTRDMCHLLLHGLVGGPTEG